MKEEKKRKKTKEYALHLEKKFQRRRDRRDERQPDWTKKELKEEARAGAEKKKITTRRPAEGSTRSLPLLVPADFCQPREREGEETFRGRGTPLLLLLLLLLLFLVVLEEEGRREKKARQLRREQSSE